MVSRSASPVFKYDPTLLAVIEDGGLIAPIAADGTLSLPLLEPSRMDDMLRQAPTLSRLEQLSAEPSCAIRVRRNHGALERESPTSSPNG